MEDQTVLGATAGNQTASATPVTINAFNHASGVLTLTSPATVNAIAGTSVNSALTFSNNGANNDALSIVTPGTGVTGLSGTFSGGQSTSSVTGTTIAGEAGTAISSTYSAAWLEDQTVLGATAGNQTASRHPCYHQRLQPCQRRIDAHQPDHDQCHYGHNGDLDLTFTNSGGNNDALAIVPRVPAYRPERHVHRRPVDELRLPGATVAGAAGTAVTATYSTTWLEDQSVIGAIAGNQTAPPPPSRSTHSTMPTAY